MVTHMASEGSGPATTYWRDVHASTGSDLGADCFPDKPVWFNDFYDRTQRFAIDRAIADQNLLSPGKRVLDLGCGRGRWLRYFNRRHGVTTTGVDIAPAAVAACRARGLAAVEGSVADLPFPDASFDLVTSVTVLMHVPDPVKRDASREIARVLRPGGHALLIESTWCDPAPHVFGMSLAAWTRMMGEAGLTLTDRSGQCFIIGHRFLPRALPGRDRLAIALDYSLDSALMRFFHHRETSLALQHTMTFRAAS
jgi:SAM-dependent methyltransferase